MANGKILVPSMNKIGAKELQLGSNTVPDLDKAKFAIIYAREPVYNNYYTMFVDIGSLWARHQLFITSNTYMTFYKTNEGKLYVNSMNGFDYASITLLA